MRAAALTIPNDAVLRVLEQHVGASNGIHVRELVQRATESVCTTAAQERSARSAIAQLRLAGHCICGQPDKGYYIAATPEELERTCQYLRGRALTSLAIEARMRKVSMPELLGQLVLSPESTLITQS